MTTNLEPRFNTIATLPLPKKQVPKPQSSRFQWRLGEGNKTRFWYDTWLGDQRLLHVYPRLFQISVQKQKFVKEVGWWEDNEWKWGLIWRRRLFEWERIQLEELQLQLQSKNPIKDTTDTWWWAHDSNGKYSVSSTYNLIQDLQTDSQEIEFLIDVSLQEK
uniref:Uncharacterized protein n=1 Tax=Cajanus cajan TaxID=3821 RepID=A0A151UEX2_CAJCA